MKLDEFKEAYLTRFNDPALREINEKSVDECVPLANEKAKGKIPSRSYSHKTQLCLL